MPGTFGSSLGAQRGWINRRPTPAAAPVPTAAPVAAQAPRAAVPLQQAELARQMYGGMAQPPGFAQRAMVSPQWGAPMPNTRRQQIMGGAAPATIPQNIGGDTSTWSPTAVDPNAGGSVDPNRLPVRTMGAANPMAGPLATAARGAPTALQASAFGTGYPGTQADMLRQLLARYYGGGVTRGV